MPIVHRKERLRSGLFGRYFNTYFSDNMGNLTSPTNSDVRTQLSSYTVGTTDTWLFRGYFLANTTATNWQFRTNSDDASWLWIGSNSTATDTNLVTGNAVVNNGGVHSAQTRTSSNISLTDGVFYPFAVVVGNNSGPGTLTVEFSSNGGTNWQSDGTGFYFHNPYAPNGYNIE
jgi:predicted acylesterase/phospholipase RssA